MPVHIGELVLTIAVTQPAPDAVQRLSLGGVTPAAEELPPLPPADQLEPATTPTAQAHDNPDGAGAGRRTQADTVARVAEKVYRLMRDDLREGHARL